MDGSGQSDSGFATRYSQAEWKFPLGSPAWFRARMRSAFLWFGGTVARPADPALRCFFLHNVYDDQVSRFKELIRGLQRFGRFVDGAELIELLAGSKLLDGPCFHLSFDDGFDNNHRNAFPVLEELGVSATFFVPSAMVEAPDSLILEHWWAATTASMPTRTMDWAAVRELSEAGHDIGSHTRHHRRLTEISGEPELLRDEVSGSKREIEDRLGKECRFFSWPYGSHADIDEAGHAAVAEAGYRACFSAVRGKIAGGGGPAMNVPRHHMEGGWPWKHVRYFALGRGD